VRVVPPGPVSEVRETVKAGLLLNWGWIQYRLTPPTRPTRSPLSCEPHEPHPGWQQTPQLSDPTGGVRLSPAWVARDACDGTGAGAWLHPESKTTAMLPSQSDMRFIRFSPCFREQQ